MKEHSHQNQGGGGGRHSHAHLIEALKDCEYLISSGGGWRVVEDLKNYDIKTLFADEELIEDAVSKFMTGELKNNKDLVCEDNEH
jgi:predicted Fe-Mo cluster-binding NifX family protein